ncbi:MAG: sodium/solute symporter [Bacteroidaceae bacterium]|nr:sodium/solute symporter [Bacteroidaceae bacterium]
MDTQISLTEALSLSGFEAVDFIILLAYIILLVSLGVYLGHNRRYKGAADYFLANNSLTWWAVGASLIAANISTEQIVGMAGASYATGIACAAYEIMAAVTLVVIGKFLLPVMMSRKILTVPQFLRERYNEGVGLAFSILWLFLYIFVNLTSVAWLGALAIEQILGLQGLTVSIGEIEISIRLLIIITLFLFAGIYSIHGGLASIAWTDVMQLVFIIGGGLITAYFAVIAVSGNDYSFLSGFDKVYTYLTSGEYAHDTHFHLIVQRSHDAVAFSSMPGLAAVVGSMWLTNLGYWYVNQFIIQKGLAAKSIQDGKKGFIFAGMLKMVMPFIAILPGVCAYYMALRSDQYTQVQSVIQVSDDAYPWLIRNFIPTGIKGLALVALIAAIISSLASLFNSTATLFTMDIYKKYIEKDASDEKLMRMGRFVSFVVLIFAAITAQPLLGDLDQSFQYIQEYSGFIYPGLIIVFTMGLFWKRASNTAATWTAILAIPLGVLFKMFLPESPFLFRAGYVFILLAVFFVTVSLFNSKTTKCELPPARIQKVMLRWGAVLGCISIFSIVSATIVTVVNGLLPATATPENSTFAYLRDIGFQAFYFFGVFVGMCAFFLISNAKEKKMNTQAIPINLSLFKTDRTYTYGTIIICAGTLLLYVIFW